jgi:hypothetical protein
MQVMTAGPLGLVVSSLILFLLLLLPSRADASWLSGPDTLAEYETDVVMLTDETFDELTAEGQWVVEFYAAAATQLRGKISFGKIDCTQHKQVKKRLEVGGYPSIKFIRDGEVRDYKGTRDEKGLVNFGRDMLEQSVLPLPQLSTLRDSFARNPVNFVFLSDGEDVDAQQAFNSVAYKTQGMYKFYELHSAESVHKKFKLEASELPHLLWMVEGTKGVAFEGNLRDEAAVRAFVDDHKLPFLSQLGGHNFGDVTDSSGGQLTVVTALHPSMENLAGYKKMLMKVAKQHAGFVFAVIDGEEFARYLTTFGVEGFNLPQTFVLDMDKEVYFHSEERQNVMHTGAEVDAFVEEMISGRLVRSHLQPWYSPSRYTKPLMKVFNALDDSLQWAIMISVGIGPLLLLMGCCFFCPGMDEESMEENAEYVKKLADAEKRSKAHKHLTSYLGELKKESSKKKPQGTKKND